MATKRLDDGRAWFEHALVGDAATDPSRARAVYDHGYLVFWSGQYDLAQQRFAQAHELAKRSGDRNLVALADRVGKSVVGASRARTRRRARHVARRGHGLRTGHAA